MWIVQRVESIDLDLLRVLSLLDQMLLLQFSRRHRLVGWRMSKLVDQLEERHDEPRGVITHGLSHDVAAEADEPVGVRLHVRRAIADHNQALEVVLIPQVFDHPAFAARVRRHFVLVEARVGPVGVEEQSIGEHVGHGNFQLFRDRIDDRVKTAGDQIHGNVSFVQEVDEFGDAIGELRRVIDEKLIETLTRRLDQIQTCLQSRAKAHVAAHGIASDRFDQGSNLLKLGQFVDRFFETHGRVDVEADAIGIDPQLTKEILCVGRLRFRCTGGETLSHGCRRVFVLISKRVHAENTRSRHDCHQLTERTNKRERKEESTNRLLHVI